MKILKRKQSFKEYMKENYLLYIFLIPMLAYLLIFSYYPMLGLQIAFKDWKIAGGIWGSPWASIDGNTSFFKHFINLFSDPVFFVKFGNTLRISLLRIIFGFPIPIILTILLNEITSVRFKKGIQIISYLPYFISWIVISGIVLSMSASGSDFQGVMKKIFGREIYFFSNDDLFLVIVILTDIWKNAGWGTVMYFAAINNISLDLYEAADIDGAKRLQKIKYITLPGLVPAISINIILTMSGIVYGGFDQIYNMYNSAVFGKGDILETYLFRIGIVEGSYDIATALGLFNSTIALILTLISNKIIKKIGGTAIW